MAAPPDASSDLQRLEDRSFRTYKARLNASERLAARGRAWNASMLAFSSALIISAIGMLTDSDLYGAQGNTLMAALSVSSLVASLVVSQLNYAVRSRDMDSNYREIQFVAQEAEYLKAHEPTRVNYERLNREYRELIRGGENQTAGDHWRGNDDWWKHGSCYRESAVTAAPWLSFVAPILLLVPLVRAL